MRNPNPNLTRFIPGHKSGYRSLRAPSLQGTGALPPGASSMPASYRALAMEHQAKGGMGCCGMGSARNGPEQRVMKGMFGLTRRRGVGALPPGYTQVGPGLVVDPQGNQVDAQTASFMLDANYDDMQTNKGYADDAATQAQYATADRAAYNADVSRDYGTTTTTGLYAPQNLSEADLRAQAQYQQAQAGGGGFDPAAFFNSIGKALPGAASTGVSLFNAFTGRVAPVAKPVAAAGMSTTTKVLLALGAVGAAGGIAYSMRKKG